MKNIFGCIFISATHGAASEPPKTSGSNLYYGASSRLIFFFSGSDSVILFISNASSLFGAVFLRSCFCDRIFVERLDGCEFDTNGASLLFCFVSTFFGGYARESYFEFCFSTVVPFLGPCTSCHTIFAIFNIIGFSSVGISLML